MLYPETAVGQSQHFDLRACIGGAVFAGHHLQRPPLVFHCVVFCHLAGVLEAQYLGEIHGGIHGAVGRIGLLGRDAELGVETRDELLQDLVCLCDSGGPGQAQLGHQPVLKGSSGPFHLALGLG